MWATLSTLNLQVFPDPRIAFACVRQTGVAIRRRDTRPQFECRQEVLAPLAWRLRYPAGDMRRIALNVYL